MNAPAFAHRIVNAFTVDVEDYFQVSALEPHFPRECWESVPCRIKRNVERILELLEQKGSRHHMTAEDIYRQLLDSGDEIGLATVYRVLTQFEAAGLVLKHNFEGGTAVYEIDRGGHHDHMVDIDTGRIVEFESPEIEKLQREIAERHGYQLEEHSLVLYVRKKR